MVPLEKVEKSQLKYISGVDQADLKARGQFFTSLNIARYMASMIDPPHKATIRLLDAGAGGGILAAALSDHIAGIRPESRIEGVLYETDPEVLPVLKKAMDRVASSFKANSVVFDYEIRDEDFVLARPDKGGERFDLSVINPPYFKINKSMSRYAGCTSDLYKGDPNIYAAFMAIVGETLSPGGQMVAITPRSFMNGLYFKSFRQWLVHKLSLTNVHIFQSRKDAFKEKGILQENVICRFVRDERQQEKITVSTSRGRSDVGTCESRTYEAHTIFDPSDDQNIIRVPEDKWDGDILEEAESWPETFESLGYRISTGPVVTFRQWDYIDRADEAAESVPLINMHNVKRFKIQWTGEHKKDVRFGLLHGYQKYLSENRNTVVLKRFSSKDEKRRLVAAVHDKDQFPHFLIGFENHLNCIYRVAGNLALNEAFGLAALFNSVFIDRYFRCISGNTQVNATEIRLMRLPSREVIERIGKLVSKSDYSDEAVEEAVMSELGVDARLAQELIAA